MRVVGICLVILVMMVTGCLEKNLVEVDTMVIDNKTMVTIEVATGFKEHDREIYLYHSGVQFGYMDSRRDALKEYQVPDGVLLSAEVYVDYRLYTYDTTATEGLQWRL